VQRCLQHLESIGAIQDVTEYKNFDGTQDKRKRPTKFGGKGNSTRYRIVDSETIWKVTLEDRAKRPKRPSPRKPRQADTLIEVESPSL